MPDPHTLQTFNGRGSRCLKAMVDQTSQVGGEICPKSSQMKPPISKKSAKMLAKSIKIKAWSLQNVVKKLNVFLYHFRDPSYLVFLPFLGSFWDPKTVQICAKTRKIRCPKITWFFHRFFTGFPGVRTPEFVLPSRRNTNFRKIDVFRKNAKKHVFLHDFSYIFGGSGAPKLLQKTSQSEVEKTSKIKSQKDPCMGGVKVSEPPSTVRADPCYARL